MVEQVETLKSRYESVEDRRKRESEGYQADVKLLREKLKHVEQQLVRAALVKAKGAHVYAFSFTHHRLIDWRKSICI